MFDCFVSMFEGADLDSLPSYGKRPNRIHVNNRKSVIHLHVHVCVLLSVVGSLIYVQCRYWSLPQLVLKFEFTCNFHLNALYDRLYSNLRHNQFLHCQVPKLRFPGHQCDEKFCTGD